MLLIKVAPARMPTLIQKNTTIYCQPGLTLLGLLLLQIIFIHGIGGRDDSYITYWSAHALAQFGEMVNYNGERIEQSSSLLHVLLLAFFYKITSIPLPTLGIVFSLTFGMISALLAARIAQRIGITYYKTVAFFICLTPAYSYWSSSGMETSLVAFSIIFLLFVTYGHLTRPEHSIQSIFLMLLAVLMYLTVRPESFFVYMAFLLVLYTLCLLYPSIHGYSVKNIHIRMALLLSLTLLVFIILCAWRYLYFGQIFPQPVYAKIDSSAIFGRIERGFNYLYLGSGLSTIFLLIIGMVQSLTKKRKEVIFFIFCAYIFLFSYLAYVISTGGDWMEAGRFLIPVIPVITILSLLTVKTKRQLLTIYLVFFSLVLLDSKKLNRVESIGLPIFAAVANAYKAGQLKTNDDSLLEYGFDITDAFNYSHLRDTLTIPKLDKIIKEFLNKNTSPVTIASRQMGMIPYYIAKKYYKQVVFIDLRGLTTTQLINCPPAQIKAPKSPSGTLFSPIGYLEHHSAYEQECLLPPAMIFYDIKYFHNSIDKTEQMLALHGFNLAYAQDHSFAQFIATKKDSSL